MVHSGSVQKCSEIWSVTGSAVVMSFNQTPRSN